MTASTVVSPEEVERGIRKRLQKHDRLAASKISIDVNGDRVILSGTVSDDVAAQEAETAALTTPGVDFVENRLELEHPLDVDVPLDEEIEANIRAILRWNTNLRAHDISVISSGGTVTLEGSVDSYWKKLRAEELAGDVLGVIAVVNELAVAPLESPSDERIARDIRTVLERVYLIDVSAVEIEVRNGTVSLRGEVTNRTSLRNAEYVATYTKGVVNVLNYLKVNPVKTDFRTVKW